MAHTFVSFGECSMYHTTNVSFALLSGVMRERQTGQLVTEFSRLPVSVLVFLSKFDQVLREDRWNLQLELWICPFWVLVQPIIALNPTY